MSKPRSQGVSLRVPPREFASAVIVRAVSKGSWATAAVLLIATGFMSVDVLGAAANAGAAAAPIGFLLLQLTALAFMFARPSYRTGIVYIVASVTCIAGYQLVLFMAEPGIAAVSQFIINRPIVALCAIAAVTGNALGGVVWCTAGFAAGNATSAAVQLWLGLQPVLGVEPFVAFCLIVVLMLWLWLSGRSQKRRVPDLRVAEVETVRLEDERDAETRAAAVIHDTVLSDLVAIVHGDDVLTERDRKRLRDDVRRLREAIARGGEWESPTGAVETDLLAVVSELQWKGLSVDVSGDSSALALLSVPNRVIALNAVRAALENVLKHAGTTTADLFIDTAADRVMIMVVDDGSGFDLEAVEPDRLGLRFSIAKRVEDAGGKSTVWSAPGAGTSVILSIPREWPEVGDEG